MQGIIAVEENLKNIQEALEQAGYEVIPLKSETLPDADAIVVSGADVNVMDIQDTLTDVPVINAVGKTADEIIDELDRL